MLAATGGINTHRGAIFGLGLLCAAAGAVAEISAEGTAVAPVRLGQVVVQLWAADIQRGPIPLFQPRRCGRFAAMVRAAREPRRRAGFAASMRWAGRPCARAARCNPTILMLHPYKRVLRL